VWRFTVAHSMPLLFLCAWASVAAVAQAASPPNFVFLLSESLDGRLLRDDSAAKIPNIRALLSSGSVQFDTAYSSNPVCAPSRASLWSGRAPHKIPHEHNGYLVNGAWNNYEGLDKNYSARLDQLLAGMGYTTGVYGKTDWTVGGHSESCMLASLTFNVAWPYNVSSNGGWNEEDATCSSPGPVEPGGSPGPSGTIYPSDWKIIDTVSSSIASLAQPFFTFAGNSILHPPYQTTAYWYNIAAERPVPQWKPLEALHPCHFQMAMKHGCTPSASDYAGFHNATRVARVRRVYLAELEEYDAMVGQVIAALEASGRRDNTWVILGADHGDMQLASQLFYKMVPYDGSSRIPLIFAHPSLGSHRVVAQPTQLLDIFPTVLRLASPSTPLPAYADGHDLAPFLQGASTDPTRPPFVLFQNHDEDQSMSWFAIANGTHKLVQFGTGAEVPPQLFNLISDPEESVDLAPSQPDAVRELDDALRTLIDYPSVALDVALYQKQQLRQWVNRTKNWQTEVVRQRWQTAWEAEPSRSMKAFTEYLADDKIFLLPCNGATAHK
jgi:arylsulfatase A-like enzyme